MSANNQSVCVHCGRMAVPVEHRCDGKAKAIRDANEHYQNRASSRPVQYWDGGWFKTERS